MGHLPGAIHQHLPLGSSTLDRRGAPVHLNYTRQPTFKYSTHPPPSTSSTHLRNRSQTTEFCVFTQKLYHHGYVQGLPKEPWVNSLPRHDLPSALWVRRVTGELGMLTCLDECSSWGGQIAPIASRTVQFTKEQLGQAEDKVSSN